MLARHVAVVRGVHEDRIVGETLLSKRVHDAADIAVGRGDQSVVGGLGAPRLLGRNPVRATVPAQLPNRRVLVIGELADALGHGELVHVLVEEVFGAHVGVVGEQHAHDQAERPVVFGLLRALPEKLARAFGDVGIEGLVERQARTHRVVEEPFVALAAPGGIPDLLEAPVGDGAHRAAHVADQPPLEPVVLVGTDEVHSAAERGLPAGE